MNNTDFDITIIGGGVIGLSICYNISKKLKNLKILLIEKESKVALINSTRNTEVIHAGIYYKKNSLKSVLCIEGKKKIYEFCKKYKIKYKKIGKLFIDYSSEPFKNLNLIKNQASLNGIDDLKYIEKKDLKNIEPNLNANLGLYSPSSGIFDSYDFSSKLEVLAINNNVTIVNNCKLTNAIKENNFWKIFTNDEKKEFIKSKIIVNASGLSSLDISQNILKLNLKLKKNFIKGCYLKYTGNSPFNHIIYPSLIPGILNERVDATPDINGGLRFGPSSEKISNHIDFKTNPDILNSFAIKIKKYFPSLINDKLKLDIVGIRPKIMHLDTKSPLDFKITCGNDFVDLVNIESPGLTSSLAIGSYVTNHIGQII